MIALASPATPTGAAPMVPPRVLIGFAEALAAPEAAWSLLEAGWEVTAFATRGSRPALRRCRAVEIVEVASPRISAQAAVDELCAHLDSGRYAAVLPLNDYAVWLADRAAVPHTPVAGATGAQAALALDKRQQLQAAAAAGLSIPPTTVVEDPAALCHLTDWPVVLKPARPVDHRADRLVRDRSFTCADAAQLRAAADAWGGQGPLLAQPLIAGVGEGLFGLAGPDGVRAFSAHRRLRMMNPQGSGSSACVSVPVDPALATGAARMLTDIGWRGLFMLEFLRDPVGTPWFMELNGRTWGSLALARRAGLEYPAWTLAQALGQPVTLPAGPPPTGQVCRHLGRDLVHLAMVLRGPRGRANTGWPSRSGAVRDVLSLRRGERFYNWRRGDTPLFVQDTLRTVTAQLSRRGAG